MNWIKKHKGILIASAVVLAVLAFAFWYGGSPSLRGWSVPEQTDAQEPEAAVEPELPQAESEKTESAEEKTDLQQTAQQPAQADQTEAVPEETSMMEQLPAQDEEPEEKLPAAEEKPETQIPEESVQTQTEPPASGETEPEVTEPVSAEQTEKTCTISISCATILDHLDWVDAGKQDLVPTDGWILLPTAVTFTEGESVFDVLQRICMERKIHMEFEYTPMYQSAYIEGIANLYEFDCGELSGWMYKVNGWFPNYGCSQYVLKDGDVIFWVYTCDLGNDVGGGFAAGG